MKNIMLESVRVKMLSLLVVVLCSAGSGSAQNLHVTRTGDPVEVDGFLNETVWDQTAGIKTFYQFEPVYNADASFGTTVKAVYDNTMIYFAFICMDPEPDRITARATKRDGAVCDDDAVAVFIDTFDDNNSAYLFKINPLGTQLDARFADNGRTTDKTWDETWYAAAQKTQHGWTCEIAIPFKSLRYSSSRKSWGFSAGRWIARLKESHFIVKDLVSTTRVSQFGSLDNLDLSELTVKKYSLMPYVQAEFEKGSTTQTGAGADIRINPWTNVGLSFTLNPDFATIEGDVEQVNLTRFELQYPEKRPFFLEGAENYSTRIKQFYSRRIGEIPWGAKVNGKVGKWNINGLATRSDPTTAGAPGPSGNYALYSVFRVNREFANGSTVGLIGANRSYEGTNSGSVGMSGTLFFTSVLGMTSQCIRSHGTAKEGIWTWFVRPAYDSQFSHFHVRYSSYGTGVKENMNAIGFIRHDDRREFDTNISHTFWLNRHGLDSVQPSVNYNQYWSQDNYLRSRDLRVDVDVSVYRKYSVELSYDRDYKAEYFPYFEKDFTNYAWGAEAGYDNKQGFAVEIEYKRGKNYDSDMEVVAGGIQVTILRGWNLEYEAEKTWLSSAGPEENCLIHYVRSTYYLTNDLFFKLFYQTKYGLNRFWRDPDFDLQRKTVQVVAVWRFLPPFGSVQLAYQEGTARHTDEQARGRTLFAKFSWVF